MRLLTKMETFMSEKRQNTEKAVNTEKAEKVENTKKAEKADRNEDPTFEVQLTADDMYKFHLYHTYSHVNGIISLLIGVIAIVAGFWNLAQGGTTYAAMYLVIGVMLLVYQPIFLKTSAKKQVSATEVLKRPITYTFREDGVLVHTPLKLPRQKHSASGTDALLTWNMIGKAVLNKNQLLLYAGKSGAYIIPRQLLADREEDVKTILREHLGKKQLKL
jgi:hypothetical protein